MQTIESRSHHTVEAVRCPNCGSFAERHYMHHQIHTQCEQCDYLLTTCAKTGGVIEAYAPGIPFMATA